MRGSGVSGPALSWYLMLYRPQQAHLPPSGPVSIFSTLLRFDSFSSRLVDSVASLKSRADASNSFRSVSLRASQPLNTRRVLSFIIQNLPHIVHCVESIEIGTLREALTTLDLRFR